MRRDWNAQRSCRAVSLRDVDAPYRLRVVIATVNAALQVAKALVETFAVRVPGDPIHARRPRASSARPPRAAGRGGD